MGTALRLLSKLACRPSIARINDDVIGDDILKRESAMKESTDTEDSCDGSTGKAAMNSPIIWPSSRLRSSHIAKFLATGGVELKESIEKMQTSINALNVFIHLITIPLSLSLAVTKLLCSFPSQNIEPLMIFKSKFSTILLKRSLSTNQKVSCYLLSRVVHLKVVSWTELSRILR